MKNEIKEDIKKYVKATASLEDIYLTDDEWNELIKAIEENHDKSFIEEVVKKVRSKSSGKIK